MNFTKIVRAQSLGLCIVILIVALATGARIDGAFQTYVISVAGVWALFNQACLIRISFKQGEFTNTLWQSVVVLPSLYFTYTLALDIGHPATGLGLPITTTGMFKVIDANVWIVLCGTAVFFLVGVFFGLKNRRAQAKAAQGQV